MSKKTPIKSKQASEKISSSVNNNLTTSSNIDFYSVALIVVIAAIALLRYRLVGIPLERDEGEYAYMGNLILNGLMPYKEAYNMKLPGTYFMYAFIMAIFGKTYSGIHLGLLLMNIATMVLLYFSLKKLLNPMVALVTITCYGIMSLSVNMLGFAAHATHFVTFFVALALFFFTKYTSNQKWIFAGLTGVMFGLSFLMKQQAVFFIIFGGLVTLFFEIKVSNNRIKEAILNILAYSFGVFIPYILVLILMLSTGNFDKFWFWTVEYASKYATSEIPLSEATTMFNMSFKPMFDEFFLIWILSFFGIIFTWLSAYELKTKIWITLFSISSFAAICPGFYFRQHYFIVLIPAVGILTAMTLDYFVSLIVSKLNISFIKIIPFLIVSFVSINAVAKGKQYFLKIKPVQLCKMIYGTNPFTESVEIANYINKNTSKDDKIAILGSEPQILVYADRMSGTGHIYTYGLMEIHDYNKKMQEEMIAEIEKSKPKYFIFCNVRTSWLPRPGSEMGIFDWNSKYTQANYELVGLADIAPQGQSPIYWDSEANRQPQSQEYILVYRRKN